MERNLSLISKAVRFGILLVALGASGNAVAAAAGPITPQNLTVWSMFANADAVVKSVMFLLIAASIATWSIWAAKLLELRRGKRAVGSDLARLADAKTLETVPPLTGAASTALYDVAKSEVGTAIDLANPVSSEAMKERLAIRLGDSEAGSVQSMLSGMNILASIGAISPFVGLFGTVWGIMNAFIGISKAQTTNLAVVAPGIAEALLTTAIGLFAAIPAVIIYNSFSRSIAGYRRLLTQASTRIACLVSREVERHQVTKRA
jgi:biopolymer transport protein ExbB